MKTIFFISSILGFILIIAACKSENTKSDTSQKNDIVNKAKNEVDTNEVYNSDDHDFMLPQPFALVSSFEQVNLVYDVTHMNDPANVKNYNSEGDKLLNFGVYSTDLVYSIIHNQPQQSMNYFNAIKKLADKIGMGSISEEEALADSIEQNITDKNVMQDLLIDVHERSQEYLISNDLRKLAAIQFAGAWIEGMYLATRNISPDRLNALGSAVTDHMSLAADASKGIKAYENREEDLDIVLKKINSINDKYESFESVKNADGQPKLTMENLTTLQKEFEELRTLIIE